MRGRAGSFLADQRRQALGSPALICALRDGSHTLGSCGALAKSVPCSCCWCPIWLQRWRARCPMRR